MADQKKRGKRSYLNDYVSAGNGSYVYTGKRYLLSGDRRRFNRLLIAAVCACAVLIIGAGCFPSVGMKNTFYVLFVYIGEVSSLFAAAWSAFGIAFGEEELKRRPYETHVKRLPARLFLLALFSILHVPASVLCAVLEGMDQNWAPSIIAWICETLCASVAFALRRRVLAARWEERDT